MGSVLIDGGAGSYSFPKDPAGQVYRGNVSSRDQTGRRPAFGIVLGCVAALLVLMLIVLVRPAVSPHPQRPSVSPIIEPPVGPVRFFVLFDAPQRTTAVV